MVGTMKIMDLSLNLKVVISSHVSTSSLVEKELRNPESLDIRVLVHSLHSMVQQKLLLRQTTPSEYSRFKVLVALLLPYLMLERVKSTLVTLELISLLRSSSPHQPLVFYSSSLVDWMSVVSRRDYPTSRQHLQKLDMQNSALLEMHLLPSILDISEVVNSISMAMLSRSIPKTTLVLVLSSHLLVEQKVSLSIFQNLQLYSDLLEMRSRRTPRTTSVRVLCSPLFPRQNLQLLSEQPKVLFNIEGASVNRILFHYPGSGTFSKFGGAAEARAVVKKAGGLFTFSGNAPESITPAPEIGSGSLFTFVGKTEAFAAADDFAPPLFKIGGDAVIGFSLGIIGRGGLDVLQKVTKLDVEGKNRFVGAQERRAVNNPASVLFSIDGNVKIFFVFQEVGGGFTRISGEAFTEVTPRHKGSGKTINGDVYYVCFTLSHIGSGTIFGFVGGAESRAVDLPPQKGLLRFAGTSPEAFQRGPEIGTASLQIKSSPVHLVFKLSHISDGSKITIFGDGAESRSRLYEGSGTLFSFSGATESRVIDLPPQIPTLFKFVETLEKEKPMHIKVLVHSSDSILQQKSELFHQNFLVSSRFRVLVQKQKPRYLLVLVHSTSTPRGMGSMFLASKFISVLQKEQLSIHQKKLKYSPSLVLQLQRKTGHTKELVLSLDLQEQQNPEELPESTGLFKVQGSGEESRSRIYSGTGRVFGFTGGAEATAVTENVPGSLFKLTGTVTVLFQRTPFVGSGSLFSFTGATETTAVAPPVATLFEFNGSGAESRTRPYQGSGTLVAFKSATVARRVPYSATQGLFKLAGALRESFVPSGYVGTTGVQFIGASADRRIEFESPKPTQIYIV